MQLSVCAGVVLEPENTGSVSGPCSFIEGNLAEFRLFDSLFRCSDVTMIPTHALWKRSLSSLSFLFAFLLQHD